jgi:hypothetical protein
LHDRLQPVRPGRHIVVCEDDDFTERYLIERAIERAVLARLGMEDRTKRQATAELLEHLCCAVSAVVIDNHKLDIQALAIDRTERFERYAKIVRTVVGAQDDGNSSHN